MTAGLRVGPVTLVHGVTSGNFWALMYASFITIGMLAGMNILQSYVLTEHLQIPTSQQGTVTGNLALWQEVIAILLIKPFGIAADRIGRRPIMVTGILVVACGLALFPFATSTAQLTGFRALFAVGAAALSSVLAVVTNDYPVEHSRGRLQGLSALMNALGVLFLSLVIARIPTFLQSQGVAPIEAGKAMFLSASLLCFLSAFIFRFGLRGGTAVMGTARRSVRQLLTSGFRAAGNPRVLLSYACAFTGRADNTLKGTFVALWAVSAAPTAGMSTADALARGGQVLGFMGIIGLLWTPLYGLLLDRLDRVTGVALAMGLAGLGFVSMGFITSPLDFNMLPAFALLSVGQISAIIASVTLVGQEADPAERGSVIAMNGWCGAVGILLAAAIGGRLFDRVGPASPFVAIGIVQLLLSAIAVAVRLRPYQGRTTPS